MMAPVQLFPLDWNMKDFPQRFCHLRTARKIADSLNVTLDELPGRQDSNGGDARIQNSELHRLNQKAFHLSDNDRKALVILLDSLVKRSKVSRVMAEL